MRNLMTTETYNCYISFVNKFDGFSGGLAAPLYIPTEQKDTLKNLISQRIELLSHP